MGQSLFGRHDVLYAQVAPMTVVTNDFCGCVPNHLGADYVISKVPYCPYVMHKMALDFTPHVVRDDISAVLTGRN